MTEGLGTHASPSRNDAAEHGTALGGTLQMEGQEGVSRHGGANSIPTMSPNL